MKWSDMLTHVLPSVAGCPDSLAEDHLVKAARRLCAETMVWNYETVPVLTTAALAVYTLQIGQGQNLVRVLSCEVDGREHTIPAGMAGRRLQRRSIGVTCVVERQNDIRLDPPPHANNLEIITEVAVKPSLDAPADWPDDLEEHVHELACGAIASLCALPGTTWFNSAVALEQEARFRDRISTVAMKVSRGFGRAHHGAAVRWF